MLAQCSDTYLTQVLLCSGDILFHCAGACAGAPHLQRELHPEPRGATEQGLRPFHRPRASACRDSLEGRAQAASLPLSQRCWMPDTVTLPKMKMGVSTDEIVLKSTLSWGTKATCHPLPKLQHLQGSP